VQILGTPIQAIIDTEDRELFNRQLESIAVKVPRSIPVTNKKDAMLAAKKVGYPIIVRAAYALGGRGSGVAKNEKQLRGIVEQAFTFAPQILVEEYLEGWKEVEYEVVRDCFDNCITVCNMENFDPLGIHTGESIVVAPSQTLNNNEYHKLREISIRTIRHFGIVGECNIQFALDPKSDDYRVIEVNARLSRSSALASKATGYPLAFIAAKLALGYSLTELQNKITKQTAACFEPALDYCVVKIPRWDLQKFNKVSYLIGTEMKSVGEVMAIGRSFEEAMQKAIRMLNIGMYGLVANKVQIKEIAKSIQHPTDKRIFALVEALKKNYSIEKLYKLSHVDKWFLFKLKKVVEIERELKKCTIAGIPKQLLAEAKKAGFSDKQIAMLAGETDELLVREKRKQLGIMPVVKQIDTLAAEFPAKTNYLYITYNGIEDDVEFNNKANNQASNSSENKQVLLLGSGSYSIGSSVEFDWCGVTANNTLRKMGYSTLMVNFNPETVSTDYDVCDRLYFEELSLERVLDIYEKEQPLGVLVSMGGQIPNNLAMKLHKANVKILGTSPESIDKAENRHVFSKLCDALAIDQPEWKELTSKKDALLFAEKAGFPVLVRPSYVLSGAAMSVAFNSKDLSNYLDKATSLSPEYPVVISKFISNAREIEIDAVAASGEIVVYAVNEHVENAGVHSGDATMVFPPQKTYIETVRRIKGIASKLCRQLCITGPFNIQFIAKQNEIKVIELNLRASRSFPFVSKVSGTNFIELATRAIIGEKMQRIEKSALDLDHVGIKAPQFSFSRLKGADPLLGVEMSSTGEVACLGSDVEDAFLKSIIAAGFVVPKKNVLVSVSGDENRFDILEEIRLLQKLGFSLYATDTTHAFLKKQGIESRIIRKIQEKKKPNVMDLFREKQLDLVIAIPNEFDRASLEAEYELRRSAIDFNIPLITNRQLAKLLIHSISKKKLPDLEIKHWQEYMEKA
jgi:carbamoyl-phosphate synthase large subunit